MIDRIKGKIKLIEYKLERLDKKIKSLDLNNKKVSLNSVISLSLPMYTLVILFSVFLLTKQQDKIFEKQYMLRDHINDCVNMVKVTKNRLIEFTSLEESRKHLGDLFPYISCREVGPKDYRSYIYDRKLERLNF